MSDGKEMTIHIRNPIKGYLVPVLISNKLHLRDNGKITEYIPEMKGGYIRSNGSDYVFSIEEIYIGDENDYKEFEKDPAAYLIGKCVSFKSHWILGPKSYKLAYWIMIENPV